MKIRFLSSNKYKIEEVTSIMGESGHEIIPTRFKIEELQTVDVKKLVKDKLLKAFQKIGKPIIVEHTGLHIKYLNNFPGGLTQIFWDSLEAERFAEIIGHLKDPSTIAKTTIGYCDGSKIHFFDGEISGKIADTPRGNRDFQWDCVFIPDGYDKTFSELGEEKNKISMRRKALNQFINFLKSYHAGAD